MERVRGWIERLRKVAPERFVLLGLLLAAAVLWVIALNMPSATVTVTAFAVGEGDALLVRAPGRTVLIDGGSRTMPDVDRVLQSNLLLAGVHKIDAIVITHPDSDHLNALPAVMDTLPVGMLLDVDLPCETDAYRTLLATAERRRIPRYRIRAGDRLNLGGGAILRILAPGDDLVADGEADDNNNSVVAMLEYGRARMLFTGDLEGAGEEKLLERNVDLQADILKIAHHGSNNGTSDAFLDAVDPSKAVISTRGTQSRSLEPLMARLRPRHIEILRTDVDGRIQLQTDGQRWRVSVYHDRL